MGNQIAKGVALTLVAIWMFLILVVLMGIFGAIQTQNDFLIYQQVPSNWQSNWPEIPKCEKKIWTRITDGC